MTEINLKVKEGTVLDSDLLMELLKNAPVVNVEIVKRGTRFIRSFRRPRKEVKEHPGIHAR